MAEGGVCNDEWVAYRQAAYEYSQARAELETFTNLQVENNLMTDEESDQVLQWQVNAIQNVAQRVFWSELSSRYDLAVQRYDQYQQAAQALSQALRNNGVADPRGYLRMISQEYHVSTSNEIVFDGIRRLNDGYDYPP